MYVIHELPHNDLAVRSLHGARGFEGAHVCDTWCFAAATESLLRRSCAAPAPSLSFCASRLMRPAFISPVLI